jgi:hypothetical protein
LPAVEGSSPPVRLPAVIALDDFRVQSGGAATINGVMYVAGDFDIPQGAENTALSVTGNVIVGQDLIVERRTEWNKRPVGRILQHVPGAIELALGEPVFPAVAGRQPGAQLRIADQSETRAFAGDFSVAELLQSAVRRQKRRQRFALGPGELDRSTLDVF